MNVHMLLVWPFYVKLRVCVLWLSIFSDAFVQNDNKQKQWSAFVKKNSIDCEIAFVGLMEQLKEFLLPIYQAVLHSKKFDCQWDASSSQWAASKSGGNGEELDQ
jgi:hypothetical protein